MIQLGIRSRRRTKNPTLTPSVVENPTLTPPKNLRLLKTSTPQPWKAVSFRCKQYSDKTRLVHASDIALCNFFLDFFESVS